MSDANISKLRLGTRGSMLARIQSGQVADDLEKSHDGLHVELCIIKTTGDQITDRPLHEAGGKGLFVKELERALLDREVDLAVHSFKDVPVTMPLVEQENLTVAAVPPREDPRDLLISLNAKSIAELPQGARVGTGSLRRRCQLLALRPDLQIEAIRGNIDTRIRKLRNGDYDAIILAMAGIKRAGLYDSDIMSPIPADEMLPAAGQAALCIETRKDNARVLDITQAVHHEPTAMCVRLERQVVQLLNGDCFSPIAALAKITGKKIDFRAVIGRRGGETPLLKAAIEVPLAEASTAPQQLLRILTEQNVQQHLHG